jgi:putative oxidoreductase
MRFLGLSSEVSLGLVIFAEFFCAIFLILGLATRFVAVPLLIDTFVALSVAHKFDFFAKGEKAALFVTIYFTILLIGPGRISVDGMIKK